MLYDNHLIKKLFSCFDPELEISGIKTFGGGLYNEAFLVITQKIPKYKCDKFVLRIAPPVNIAKLFYEINMMNSEPVIHRLVLDKTSIPAPPIFFWDFSKKEIESDYLIMEFLKGKSGYYSRHELGTFVRQLHSIEGEHFGYPERGHLQIKSSWKETFFYYVENIFKDCLNVQAISQNECSWFINIFQKHENVIKETKPCLLHLDLWSANILTENGKITGILDYDRGMFGDIELEFAVLDTYNNAIDDFFKGYGLGRPADKEARIRQKLYIVYELIKYAFIRLARGGSPGVSRNHVNQCKSIIQSIA